MAEAAPTTPPLIRPKPLKWHQKLAADLIFVLLSLLNLTLRKQLLPPPTKPDMPEAHPVIYTIWHNRLFLSMMAQRVMFSHFRRTRGMAAIVSASQDGGILARLLGRFGNTAVRGSSSRRGPQALRELTTVIRNGLDVAITPDGPRGPRYEVKPGVISLAQLTGVAIYPVVIHYSHKIQMKSWDRFQVPLPFSRCEFRMADPLTVPRDATEEEREAIRQSLQQSMMAMTED